MRKVKKITLIQTVYLIQNQYLYLHIAKKPYQKININHSLQSISNNLHCHRLNKCKTMIRIFKCYPLEIIIVLEIIMNYKTYLLVKIIIALKYLIRKKRLRGIQYTIPLIIGLCLLLKIKDSKLILIYSDLKCTELIINMHYKLIMKI